jgi:hypothetical protein
MQKQHKMERDCLASLFTVSAGPTGRRYGFVCRVSFKVVTEKQISFDTQTTTFIRDTFTATGSSQLACLIDNQFFVFNNSL